MEGLEILGNATMIPIVIFLTQMIKTSLPKHAKYRSDILALMFSLLLCLGSTFYIMTSIEFSAWVVGDFLMKFKWGVDQVLIGFATWLAASKVYDLGHGNKKRASQVSGQIERHLVERSELQKEIVKLKNGQGDSNEQAKTDGSQSDVLRAILEG